MVYNQISKNNDYSSIPDDVYFALSGKDAKKILEIMDKIITRDRNKLFSIMPSECSELSKNLMEAKKIKFEAPKQSNDNKPIKA